MTEVTDISKLIESSTNILMCVHSSPDLDSLCANFAMAQYLLSTGKKFEVYCIDELPNVFGLFDSSFVHTLIDPATLDSSKYDLFLGLDLGSENLVTRVQGFKFQSPKLKRINIDHHKNDHRWADINLIDSERASTCSLLYDFLKDVGFELSKEVKAALLFGYLSDSLVFSIQLNSKDLRFAAELMDAGVDIEYLTWCLNFNTEYEAFEYKVKILDNVIYDRKRNIAWSKLSFKDKEGLGGTLAPDKRQFHRAVEFFKDIKGIRFAVMFNENERGYVSASFRSNLRDFDVSKVAEALGGGGHKFASAAVFKGAKLDEVIPKFFEILDREFPVK